MNKLLLKSHFGTILPPTINPSEDSCGFMLTAPTYCWFLLPEPGNVPGSCNLWMRSREIQLASLKSVYFTAIVPTCVEDGRYLPT